MKSSFSVTSVVHRKKSEGFTEFSVEIDQYRSIKFQTAYEVVISGQEREKESTKQFLELFAVVMSYLSV